MKTSESITVLKIPEKPININAIIFDTETRTEQTPKGKELKLLFGYFKKVIEGQEITNFEDNRFFFTKEDFTKYILTCEGFPCSGKKKYVWAHNMSFDFRIGISTKILKDNGFTISCFSATPCIIEYFNEKTEETILFLDTFNFFKTSIEALGKYFGIEKIQIDFEHPESIDMMQLRERCKRDVEVCLKVLENLYPQMGCKVKVSAAQMAFHAVRQLLPYDIQKINTQLSDLSYHGGRVEVFRNDKAYTKKYDVNSMYPYVMQKYEYPVGLEGFYLYPTKRFFEMQIEKGLGFIADCNFNIPENVHVPSIPLNRQGDNKLIFPVGKFRAIACQPEINMDYVTSINSVEFYYMGKIFEDFIKKYYPLKQTSEGFMREFYKVGRLNSSYGKFAQSKIKTERFKKYDNLMDFGCSRLTDLKDITHNMKFLDGECFVNIKGSRKFSVAVASFVCSYARADLYNRTMNYLNDAKDLYYFDTDCFVLPEQYSLQTNDELGGIKLEDEGISQFFAPKIYYYIKRDNPRLVWNNNELEFTNKFYNPKDTCCPNTIYFDKFQNKSLKMKGVSKNWFLEWEKDQIRAKGKKFSNFTETLNKGSVGIYEYEQEKKIKLHDDKRIWNSFISQPIKY